MGPIGNARNICGYEGRLLLCPGGAGITAGADSGARTRAVCIILCIYAAAAPAYMTNRRILRAPLCTFVRRCARLMRQIGVFAGEDPAA